MLHRPREGDEIAGAVTPIIARHHRCFAVLRLLAGESARPAPKHREGFLGLLLANEGGGFHTTNLGVRSSNLFGRAKMLLKSTTHVSAAEFVLRPC